MTSEDSPRAIAIANVAAIAEFLDGARIAYELVEHDPALNAAAEPLLAGEPPHHVAKTVVLRDGAVCVVAAIPASERLDLRKLRELLGSTRHLRLASEDEIARDFPQSEVRATPPFGPNVPATAVIDHALLGQQQILCAAGDHSHSVLVDPRDIVRVTAAKTADICQQ